ncbi:MAG: hypothetical protein HKN47_11685 [Pirellulaceae bacterium]|nr:hypothetical protein [Pirellulaceae bacterium]
MNHNRNPGSQIHVQRNERTRRDWQSYAQHRREVTRIVMDAGKCDSPDRTLAILGAGNGNDLDLESLATRYRSITLIDLDAAAVHHCLSNLSALVRKQIDVIAPLDLSGILDDLAKISPGNSALTDDAVDVNVGELITRASQVPITDLPSWDVVVSTCLISQIMDSIHQHIPPSHPRSAEVVLAAREGHLRLLSRLTRPGGVSILITDVVSSDTLPELPLVDSSRLTEVLSAAISARNFFTGLNPVVLINKLSAQSDPTIRSTVTHPPWRWNLGDRCYAVVAIQADRIGAEV